MLPMNKLSEAMQTTEDDPQKKPEDLYEDPKGALRKKNIAFLKKAYYPYGGMHPVLAHSYADNARSNTKYVQDREAIESFQGRVNRGADPRELARDLISRRESEGRSAGTIGGIIGGGALGALAGSHLGGSGAVLGGIAGAAGLGYLGSRAGAHRGRSEGESIVDRAYAGPLHSSVNSAQGFHPQSLGQKTASEDHPESSHVDSSAWEEFMKGNPSLLGHAFDGFESTRKGSRDFIDQYFTSRDYSSRTPLLRKYAEAGHVPSGKTLAEQVDSVYGRR